VRVPFPSRQRALVQSSPDTLIPASSSVSISLSNVMAYISGIPLRILVVVFVRYRVDVVVVRGLSGKQKGRRDSDPGGLGSILVDVFVTSIAIRAVGADAWW